MRADVGPLEILVECAFHEKDRVKLLPGARWDRGLKSWTFPATPYAARQLLEFLDFDEQSQWKLEELRDGPPEASRNPSNRLPRDFCSKLWAHQARAVDFAFWRPATMLAMEMRTGKTAVAIALASLWGSKRVLVTCPLSVVGVWLHELERHSGQPWAVMALDSGSVAWKAGRAAHGWGEAARLKRPYMLVLNHESTWREPMADFIGQQPWDLLIVDESHRAKAAGGKFSRFLGDLADKIPRRLALTGTPLPHSIIDAYAQYRFLDRSIFGTSANRMKNRYTITASHNKHVIIGYQRKDEFSARFHEIAFEVTTAEAFDLPEEMDITRTVRLEPKAQKAYDSLVATFWAEVESGQVTASNALSKLLRLQQVTSGWVKNDDDEMVQVSTAKIDLLRDFLEDVPTKEPIVIFVRFTKDVEQVRELCESQGRVVAEVSGQRKELTDAGTFPEDADVVVAQIQSGSLGINLSRAATAIFYSWGWSLGDVLQARARIRHADQTRKLQFVHLVVEKSIDERMRLCLDTRKDFIEDVLEIGRARRRGSEHQSPQEIRGQAE